MSTGHQLRLRIYEDKDYPKLQDLFMYSVGIARHSEPVSESGILHALDYIHRSRLFSNFLKHRKWSLILSTLSARSLLTYMEIINHLYIMEYCKDIILNDDLKVIAGRYQSREALKKGSQFWVVEDDMNNIIVYAGLDTTGSTPEVRWILER
ncbi:hypothetical protein BDQ17DRAFT_1327985 [Cyathus striatus]|nr:hypothetical protein BDQ17DRAFT_1327985 [Cyathus striatus]